MSFKYEDSQLKVEINPPEEEEKKEEIATGTRYEITGSSMALVNSGVDVVIEKNDNSNQENFIQSIEEKI